MHSFHVTFIHNLISDAYTNKQIGKITEALMSKIFPITEFDSMTLPASMHIFKAIIPFMDYNLQRTTSTFVRANELMHTINFYKNPSSVRAFSSCSNDFRISANSSMQDILSNDNIINMIMKYCPEETENMINQFRNYSKMSDLFNMYNSTSKNMNGFTFDEKNVMNPSQQKLYNEYIHQLDEIDLSQMQNRTR